MQTAVQCPNCYRMLPHDARFCASCGRAIDPQPYGSAPVRETTQLAPLSAPAGPLLSSEERNWAMLSHLSALLVFVAPYAHILGPLLIWLLKRETSPFVDDQSKEALNFNISMIIYLTVAAVLSCAFVGIPLLIGLALFHLVIVIVAAVRAANGEHYRYPLTIRFIK